MLYGAYRTAKSVSNKKYVCDVVILKEISVLLQIGYIEKMRTTVYPHL